MESTKIKLSKARSVRSITVRAVTATLLATVALCGWQFYSALQSSDSARHAAKHEWASVSSARSAFLQEYESECERSVVSASEIKASPLRSFEQCAEQLASGKAVAVGLSVSEAAGLSRAISVAADRVVLPAPLRWL